MTEAAAQAATTEHIDPVCGMTVDEKKAAATATRDGKTYYFCSAGCKDKFTKNPQQYRS
jgi:Cu+-exporting ATPase